MAGEAVKNKAWNKQPCRCAAPGPDFRRDRDAPERVQQTTDCVRRLECLGGWTRCWMRACSWCAGGAAGWIWGAAPLHAGLTDHLFYARWCHPCVLCVFGVLCSREAGALDLSRGLNVPSDCPDGFVESRRVLWVSIWGCPPFVPVELRSLLTMHGWAV